MPSWKKVIVSGSDASLSSLNVATSLTASIISASSGITGSLFGTSSWAQNSLTSSFITPTGTNAFVQGGNSFGATALLGTNDTQDLQFETNGSVRMTISSSGNVGIGTTSPLFGLHILGTSPGNSTFNQGILIENNNVTTGEACLAFRTVATPASNYWFTGNNQSNAYEIAYGDGFTNANTALSISTGLNVGIGIIASLSRLHVRGAGATSATTAFRVENSNQNASLVVLDNGNVGIGTTAPSASLHVQGNLQISTGSLYTYGQNTDIDSGSIRTVMSVSTGSYQAAFFDYVLNKSTNARAGIVFSVWNGTSVEWNDVSTNDIGNTTEVNLSVGLSGANVVLYASSSTNDWSVKALARMI